MRMLIKNYPVGAILCGIVAFVALQAMEEKKLANDKKRKVEEIGIVEEQDVQKKQKLNEEEVRQQKLNNTQKLFKTIAEKIKAGDVQFIQRLFNDAQNQKNNLMDTLKHLFNMPVKQGDRNLGTLLTIALVSEGRKEQQAELAPKRDKIAKLILDSDIMTDQGLNIQDQEGVTSLMWAAYRNQNEMLEVLLKKGADIDTKSHSNGTTALMLAVPRKNFDGAALLIAKGANLNIRNKDDGTNVLDSAVKWYQFYQEVQQETNKVSKEVDALFDLIKQLLMNNAEFDAGQTYTGIINEVKNYNRATANHEQDALYKAIAATEEFTPYDWLTLAILRNDVEQIQYCINKGIFTKEDVKYLTLYLQEIRQKTPQQLITLVENKNYSAFDVLYSFVNTELAMFIDIVPQLLEKLNKNEREELLEAAKRRNNKQLGKQIVKFNQAVRGFLNKQNQKVFLHGEDIEKNIASYI